MVARKYRLIPLRLRNTKSFREDFKLLLSLTSGQINKLAELSSSEDGFYFSDELVDKVAATLGIEDREIARIVSVARHLYTRASSERIYEEGAAEVCDFAKDIGVKDSEDKLPAVRRLLRRNEEHEYDMLALYSGSIAAPTMSDVTAACDIRAVVDPRTDEVLGYVPIALVGLELETPEVEKRTVTLQLSEDDLNSLLDELNKAKQLLGSLKEKFGGRIRTTKKRKG